MLTGGEHRPADARGGARLAGARRGRLAPAGRLVGRRAVPAVGRPGAQRDARPGRRCSTPCRSTRRGSTRCPPSDGPDGDDPEAAAARYADELARGCPARGPRGRAAFDVLPARRRTGRAHRVAVPGPAGGLRRPAGRGGARGAQAAADPDHVHGAGHPGVARGVGRRRGRGQGEGRHDGACRGPGRRRCRRLPRRGRDRTLWLLDKAAAGTLPARLGRIASP